MKEPFHVYKMAKDRSVPPKDFTIERLAVN